MIKIKIKSNYVTTIPYNVEIYDTCNNLVFEGQTINNEILFDNCNCGSYKLDSNNYDVYVAVAYENITTDSGISYATTELHATTLTIEDYDVWGFESEEDLYNSLPNTYDAKIIATNGLYKK